MTGGSGLTQRKGIGLLANVRIGNHRQRSPIVKVYLTKYMGLLGRRKVAHTNPPQHI